MVRILILTMMILAAAVIEGSVSGSAASGDDAHFPSVRASNLEKRDMNLPADFEGERNLLLVAFEREQQKDVDTWLREMKRFEATDPGFRYYELPTIQKMNSLARWFIDSGMRRGIPDRKARERTITLYLEKQPFCEALGIRDQKKIYQFLVDRKGRVLWRADGSFDEAKGASLRRALGEHKQ